MITLTTDFGDSAYVGALKGALYRAHPEARVVDVTHGVPPHDVVAGALALYAAAPYFPAGSVHVGVVDPGVGSARRGLVVEAEAGFLVGPDNGLLIPAARRLGLRQVRAIQNPEWTHAHVSATFHGRDVFAPVAARLDLAGDATAVGPVIEDFVDLDFVLEAPQDGLVEARILAIDPFGTAILNAPSELVAVGEEIAVRVGAQSPRLRVARTFSDVPPGEALLLHGSTGFIELAVNRGSAKQRFELAPGQTVTLRVARETPASDGQA